MNYTSIQTEYTSTTKCWRVTGHTETALKMSIVAYRLTRDPNFFIQSIGGHSNGVTALQAVWPTHFT